MIALITFRRQNGRPELSIGSNISSQNKNVLFSIRIILLSISALKHTLPTSQFFAVWRVPYACAQPYHLGNGSHGQLFRLHWTHQHGMAPRKKSHLRSSTLPFTIKASAKAPPPLLIKRKSFPWLPLPRWYGCVHAYTSVLKLVIFFTAFLLEERRPAHLNFIFENGQKYK